MGEEGKRIVARNRKARHEYEILETFEAGLVLKGPEVKSVREGKVGFQDAYARLEGGRSGYTASTSLPTSRRTASMKILFGPASSSSTGMRFVVS